jgi:hypothetical protein
MSFKKAVDHGVHGEHGVKQWIAGFAASTRRVHSEQAQGRLFSVLSVVSNWGF